MLIDDNIGELDLFEREKYAEVYDEPTILKRETVENVFKTKLPKSKDVENKPLIIQKAEEPNHLNVIVPGLDEEEIVIKQRKSIREYPAFEPILDECQSSTVLTKIIIDFNEMMKVCKMMQELNSTSTQLELTIYKDFNGIKFEHYTSDIALKGLFMPFIREKDKEDSETQTEMEFEKIENLPVEDELEGTKLDPSYSEGQVENISNDDSNSIN